MGKRRPKPTYVSISVNIAEESYEMLCLCASRKGEKLGVLTRRFVQDGIERTAKWLKISWSKVGTPTLEKKLEWE